MSGEGLGLSSEWLGVSCEEWGVSGEEIVVRREWFVRFAVLSVDHNTWLKCLASAPLK